jgi:ribonuclease R
VPGRPARHLLGMAKPPAKSGKAARQPRGRVPARDEILSYVDEAGGDLSQRDLLRAFGLKGQERTRFKRVLRELQDEGALPSRRQRPSTAPSVAVLEVALLDPDGELLARLASEAEDAPPRIRVLADGARGPAPGVGDRVLARIAWQHEDEATAEIIRVLRREPRRLVGLLQGAPDGLRLEPTGEGGRRELLVREQDRNGAGPGDLVVAERLAGAGLGRAKVVERLGRPEEPGAISLFAAQTFGLPVVFAPEAEAEAAAATPVAIGRRVDLRELPLVTIDGADARDFDDAVFAEPDQDTGNPGGWHMVVAIADVAHYARPGDALELEARRRGNSVYFPDRVLPMLPEALSNGLCSLRPDEDRACLAVHLWYDRQGRKLRHRFIRGLMRSRARLTYEQVQAAVDGAPDATTTPLLDGVIRPLYGAHAALAKARRKRGTLDLDLPEAEVRLGPDGRPAAIIMRPRLDCHRLIEEFMIGANVAAAETLDRAGMHCMYRIHDAPDPIKLEALAQLLQSLGMGRGPGTLARPADLSRLLEQLKEHELSPIVSQLVLRAQSQAAYAPRNIGHFGLNLGHYAHFTSPIRRYADLIVHRALIAALRLGDDGLAENVTLDDLQTLGAHLSRCERRAMEAERSALSRFVALLLAERIGTAFMGVVTGVQKFGLFVRLDETMAEGLVPVATLGEFFAYDPGRQALIGRSSGTALALGCRAEVELTDVDVLTGQITFRLLDHEPGPAAAARRAWAKGRRPTRTVLRRSRRR